MPVVIPFELRRFGAALVLSIAALACSADSSLATDAKTPPDAKPPTEAKPPADAESSADSKAPVAGAERPDPAHAGGKAGKSEPHHRKADTAAAAETAADAEAPQPALKTIVQARDEAEKEGRRNGTRSKAADGSLIVWDKVNSVWVAPSPKNTYWVDDRYYQFNEGIWMTAKTLAGPWEMTSQRFVPEAPRGRHIAPKVSVTAKLPSGIEAVYEPRIKVFKIVGRKGLFLFDGTFYRYDGGVWLGGKTEDGPWAPTSASGLPQALRRALSPPEQGTRVTLPTGEVLVNEGEPNLFAVEGKPDVLYFDGTYYERRDSKWFVSTKSGEGWEETSSQKIPGMVRSNYHKSGDDKGAKNKQGGNRKPGEKKPGEKKAAGKKAAGENTDGEKKSQAQKKNGAKAGGKAGAKKTTEDTAPQDSDLQ